MAQRFLTLLFIACLLLTSVALAWDGRWNIAPSGSYPLPEPTDKGRNIETDAGTDERPQSYNTTLPPRDYANVDPEEIIEAGGKDYSPYALVRITQDFRINGKIYTKGYYHIKAGQWGDGSLNTQSLTNQMIASREALPAIDDEETKKQKKQPMDVFLLKRNGNVLTVVPIHGRQGYAKQKGEKLPSKKTALAWVEYEGPRPVLKFYYKKTVYFTYLDI